MMHTCIHAYKESLTAWWIECEAVRYGLSPPLVHIIHVRGLVWQVCLRSLRKDKMWYEALLRLSLNVYVCIMYAASRGDLFAGISLSAVPFPHCKPNPYVLRLSHINNLINKTLSTHPHVFVLSPRSLCVCCEGVCTSAHYMYIPICRYLNTFESFLTCSSVFFSVVR
jgi:hypothetical protein